MRQTSASSAETDVGCWRTAECTAGILGLTACARDAVVHAQMVPPERLLVFEPKDGWEPLCKFLGKPVPDQPFPHVNDTEQFQKFFSSIKQPLTFFTYAAPVWLWWPL